MSHQVPAVSPGRPRTALATGMEQGKLTVMQRQAMNNAEHQADVIRDAAFPATMASAVPFGEEVGAAGWKLFRDRLLAEAGNPTDPIEVMLVEQLALAHYRIVQLHAQAEQSKSVDQAKTYTAAAARLTGEFRRLALAVKLYREPPRKKRVTFVQQQNVAGGDQQIAYVPQSSNKHEAPLLSDTKQESRKLTYAPTETIPTQSPACGSRTPEPQAARSIDRGGA